MLSPHPKIFQDFCKGIPEILPPSLFKGRRALLTVFDKRFPFSPFEKGGFKAFENTKVLPKKNAYLWRLLTIQATPFRICPLRIIKDQSNQRTAEWAGSKISSSFHERGSSTDAGPLHHRPQDDA